MNNILNFLDVTIKSNGNSYEEKCEDCNGTGKNCNKCKHYHDNCISCDFRECWMCEGTGKIT